MGNDEADGSNKPVVFFHFKYAENFLICVLLGSRLHLLRCSLTIAVQRSLEQVKTRTKHMKLFAVSRYQ
jgi:hypothetical protein